ncbi:MAG: ABC transporter permease [Firmicutes bacterium]|nr:ABC transporter permease [Bacillota bacterium]
MRDFFIIISFTFKQAVKRKSFWMANIMMAVLVCIIMLLVSKLPVQQLTSGSGIFSMNNESFLSMYSESAVSSNNNTVSSESKKSMPKVLVQDPDGVLGNYINILNDLNYNFVVDNSLTMDEIKSQINNQDVYSAVIIGETDGSITFNYITYQNSAYTQPDADLISAILKNIQTAKILSGQGISNTDIALINTPITYDIQNVKDMSFLNTATAISIILAFILYFAIFFYSYSISSSITSEKTSRVIETLVTSASPANIILGKTISMGILGLLQLLFLGTISVISFDWFVTSNTAFINNIFTTLNLSPINIIILFVYFLLGYLLFAFINAITGTTASKPEDIPLVNLPVSLLLMLSLVLSVFGTFFPDGNFNKFISVFPITSAFAMPGRLLTGYAGYGEVIASILCLIIAIAFIAFLAIRIYSVAILHSGNRLKIKDLFNMFIRIK